MLNESYYLEKFVIHLLTERRVAHNTFVSYKKDVEQYISYIAKEEIDFAKATSKDIKHYLKKMKNAKLSSRTMSRKISSLKTFYRYLSSFHRFEDISTDLTFPKLEKRLPVHLTEEEVKQLLQIAAADGTALGLRNKVMLYLLYVTGMRITELLSLRLSDLQFSTSLIAVSGKGGKGRMIPIPEMMIGLLKEYIDRIELSQKEKKKKPRATDYLFPIVYAGKVKAITRQAFWGILKELWKKTGNKKIISPHKIRHSFATHMLKSGADLRSLQLLLGHENLSTVQIYTHLETGYMRSIYDKKHPRS